MSLALAQANGYKCKNPSYCRFPDCKCPPVPFDSRDMPVRKELQIAQLERSAFAVKYTGGDSVLWAERVARELGKRPDDIVFLNEVSLDSVKWRPVLNTEVLNVLFEDLQPGAIYAVGRLHLRKTIVILDVNQHNLTAPPALLIR